MGLTAPPMVYIGLYNALQQYQCMTAQINEFSPSNMLPSSPNSNVTVKSEDFNEFFSHFEIAVTLHGWDFKTKSLFLASNLAGSARALLTELNETQRMDYKSLVDKLKPALRVCRESRTFPSPT